jgi:hypothetical protein
MPKGCTSIGASSGSVSAAPAATGHHGGLLASSAGFVASPFLTLYPARSTAASRWLTGTVDRACTVVRSVARFTEAAITPGTLSRAD